MTEQTSANGQSKPDRVAERSQSKDLQAVDVQRHIDLGLDLYRNGDLHEAFVEFLQVLAIDQNDPLGHYLCGLTLQALNLEDMAVAEWAAASSLYVRDGGKWDSDWDWIKQKSYQFAQMNRQPGYKV